MLEWLKDKTYYRKKANTLENDNKMQRETFEEATREWSQQLLDKKFDIEYKNKQLDLKDNTIKKLKERLKELEIGGEK